MKEVILGLILHGHLSNTMMVMDMWSYFMNHAVALTIVSFIISHHLNVPVHQILY